MNNEPELLAGVDLMPPVASANGGTGILIALSLCTLLVHFLTNWRYGYFGDELYFIACGDHLAWGYVDQPPLIAFIARFTRVLLGDSVFAIHFFPGVAHAVLVFMTGWTARRLGGDRFAQLLAALSALVGTGFLFTGTVLTMNAFEPLLWLLGADVVIVVLQGGSPRLWVLFGLVMGIGLLNKHSMLIFGFSIVVGLLVSARRQFSNRWIWVGALIALLIFLPNLVWEAQNGWVTLDAMRQSKEFNRLPFRLADFVLGNVMMTGPLLVPIAIAGLVFYFSRFGGKIRVLGTSFVVTVAVVILSEGKVYYALPAYPALLAGGAVMIGKLAEMRRWSWQKPVIVSLLVASGVALAPGALPVLSPEALVRYQDLIRFRGLKFEKVDGGEIPSYLASMIGWENLVETVARAYQALPSEQRGRTALLANSYAQAGAIDLLGPKLGLPKAISGHETYALWGPGGHSGELVISVGIPARVMGRYYGEVEQVGVAHTKYAQPHENDVPILLCREPKEGRTLREVWPEFQRFH
ncbi:MAG: glycosyltransferase family 39 protein [Deltaproteobacteria bacterium]